MDLLEFSEFADEMLVGIGILIILFFQEWLWGAALIIVGLVMMASKGELPGFGNSRKKGLDEEDSGDEDGDGSDDDGDDDGDDGDGDGDE